MSKKMKHGASFAPLRVLHPVHPVVGGVVIVATKTRTGHGIHLATVASGDSSVDNRLMTHTLQLLASGNLWDRFKIAIRLLRGAKVGNPEQEEDEE